MSLKKRVKRYSDSKNDRGDEMTNAVNRNGNLQESESTIEEVEEENVLNKNDFSNSNEEIIGQATPLIGLEIELQPQILIYEGQYNFKIKNLAIENEVETPYGIKDKLMIEFLIFTISNENEVDYDYNLKQKYNLSANCKSEFYKVYMKLTGNPPIGKINLRNLLGITGICEVTHVKMDNGNIFPKIVNLSVKNN